VDQSALLARGKLRAATEIFNYELSVCAMKSQPFTAQHSHSTRLLIATVIVFESYISTGDASQRFTPNVLLMQSRPQKWLVSNRMWKFPGRHVFVKS